MPDTQRLKRLQAEWDAASAALEATDNPANRAAERAAWHAYMQEMDPFDAAADCSCGAPDDAGPEDHDLDRPEHPTEEDPDREA